MGVWFIDLQAQWLMDQYTLKQNGLYSGDEITEEQKAAINKLVIDTARNYACITGLIYSGVISVVVFFVGRLFQYFTAGKKSASLTAK